MSEAASSGGWARTFPVATSGRARSAREPRSYSVRGSRARSARGSRGPSGSALNVSRGWVRSPTRSVWRPATRRESWEGVPLGAYTQWRQAALVYDNAVATVGPLLDTGPEGQDTSPAATGNDEISFRGSSVSVTVEDFLSDTSAPSSVPSSARGRYSTVGAAWEIAPVWTPPPSPGASWLAEPPSIDEPLLLFDEPEATGAAEAETRLLRTELQAARAASKNDRADLEAMRSSRDASERARGSLSAERRQLEQENAVLRSQLENHHGIMASDWATTLGFQERLRQEEAARARLAAEVQELRQDAAARAEEATSLRLDASRWQVLQGSEAELAGASAEDLAAVSATALPAVARLHAEMAARGKRAQKRLTSELELRLCVVCRDREKSVLFAPCNHICVCELCRGRLRPYRCPICQEPVQMHVARVHF